MREHLYRWTQWNIVQSSTKFDKRNADTVEFKLEAPADAEAKLTYAVQYQWSESLMSDPSAWVKGAPVKFSSPVPS